MVSIEAAINLSYRKEKSYRSEHVRHTAVNPWVGYACNNIILNDMNITCALSTMEYWTVRWKSRMFFILAESVNFHVAGSICPPLSSLLEKSQIIFIARLSASLRPLASVAMTWQWLLWRQYHIRKARYNSDTVMFRFLATVSWLLLSWVSFRAIVVILVLVDALIPRILQK